MKYAVISASQWDRKMPASCRRLYGDMTYAEAVDNGTFPWVRWSADESEFLIKEKLLPLSKGVDLAAAADMMALPEWEAEEPPETLLVDYSTMTVVALRELARDSDVVGYSRMKKADLVSALELL